MDGMELFGRGADVAAVLRLWLTSPGTYLQLGMAIAAGLAAHGVARALLRGSSAETVVDRASVTGIARLRAPIEAVAGLALAVLLLLVAVAVSDALLGHSGLLRAVLLIIVLLLFERLIRLSVRNTLAAHALRWIGLPVLLLYLTGLLDPINAVLDRMAIDVGNLRFTLSGLLRVALFGSLLFWLGWMSNSAGQRLIRRQERLDVRTREVAAKLFQIALYAVVVLLLLQIMGINLTALAVFGGALGVGLGFGLQSIAANFISGIIILFDRSVTVGDYVELQDGLAGTVRELNMRYATLETFDGKNIVIPNDTFITAPFTNWTHRTRKQRYRVDFSVAYHTDVRRLCELIRATVASHPQVLSGDALPIEERPDCEIAGFGDSGIDMFVEFWMEGIDDGKNRVGGDLLLLILETLQANGIEIPFPQREVRIIGRPPG